MFFLVPSIHLECYCTMRSTVAISSPGKSLTRSKKGSIPKNIIRKTEEARKNKNGDKIGKTLFREISLISGNVPKNPGQTFTLSLNHLVPLFNFKSVIAEDKIQIMN